MVIKIVLLVVIVLSISLIWRNKNEKKSMKTPADKIDVPEIKQILEDDLQAVDIAIGEVSEQEIESTSDAIISDLEAEAEEYLSDSLNSSVSDLALSENDTPELENLWSEGSESLILGAFRSLGMSLGMKDVEEKDVQRRKVKPGPAFAPPADGGPMEKVPVDVKEEENSSTTDHTTGRREIPRFSSPTCARRRDKTSNSPARR